MFDKVPVFDPRGKDLKLLRLKDLNGPRFSPFPAFILLSC